MRPPLLLPTSASAAADLADIHAQAFESPWSAQALADLLDQAGVSGLAAAGEGFILYRAVADEAEILTLAVAPAARRRSLGRRLVEAAAADVAAQGVSRLFLEVAEDNGPARGLYARTGFVEAGKRRGYYARPGGSAIDAVVLSLDLTGRLPSA